MRPARLALLVAAVELRRRFRDRSALVFAFIGPLAISAILGTALVVADEDRTEVAAAFAEVLRSTEVRQIVTMRAVASSDAAERLVRDGDSPFAVVFPAGFGQSLQSQRPLPVEVFRRADSAIASDVGEALVEGYLARVQAGRHQLRVEVGRLAVSTLLASGRAFSEPQLRQVAQEVAAGDQPADLDTQLVQPRGNLIGYFGPGMAILFLFFSMGVGARSLLAERQLGTMARLQAAPIGSSAILAGKAIAILTLGTISMFTVWGATVLVFDATWGVPQAVAPLAWAAVVSVAGLTALITTIARDDRQAQYFAAAASFPLALLGGSFFPPNVLPVSMARVSRLTPNGLALQTFGDLAFGGLGAERVVGPVIALIAMGVLTGALAVVRFQRAAFQ
jgi:ABC-2 type transport system permease protein